MNTGTVAAKNPRLTQHVPIGQTGIVSQSFIPTKTWDPVVHFVTVQQVKKFRVCNRFCQASSL